MVFDLRGRRKRVIQVVYAILALLMALSLLTVVGPFSIGDVFGGGGSDVSEVSLERAEDLERRLTKDPQNETLMLALVRERIAAGNNLVEFDEATGQPIPTAESAVQYEGAADTWDRYLTTVDGDPNPNVAQQMSGALFSLAQSATTPAAAQDSLEEAAEAQGIVARARPNLGTLSTYAIYSYFALDFERGDRIAKQAVAEAPKSEQNSARQQLASFREQAKAFEQQLNAPPPTGGQPGQELGNPLGDLSGGGTGLGTPAAP